MYTEMTFTASTGVCMIYRTQYCSVGLSGIIWTNLMNIMNIMISQLSDFLEEVHI